MVISDGEPHFIDKGFQQYLLRYGIHHNVATPYHAQTNGQEETSKKQIKNILQKTVNEMGIGWKDRLPNALWAYRMAYKTPIGMSPYQLVYGKTYHLLVELEFKAQWLSEDGTWTWKPHESKGRCNSLSLMNGEKNHITILRFTRREPKDGMIRG
jgi:hypothetical protein